jgi:hypothetical protein
MATPETSPARPGRWIVGVAVLAAAAAVGGCRSLASVGDRPAGGPPIEEGAEHLSRPLPGTMVALYRMRVPSTGGLRLSVAGADDGPGRMTVSEPFGAAVLLAGWEAGQSPSAFDLRKGCRLDRPSWPGDLGLGGLPLRRLLRLLGGRLPALTVGEVRRVDDRVLEIAVGRDTVRATLARDPWRVVSVVGGGFEIDLEGHTSSLPGRLRFRSSDGERADLELVRLQWHHDGEWTALPDLPACVSP